MTDWRCPLEAVETGTGRCISTGRGPWGRRPDTVVLSLGPLGNVVAEAIKELAAQGDSTPLPAHYDMRFLKPLDHNIMETVARDYDNIITVEDGALSGGMGSAVLEWLSDHGHSKHVRRGHPRQLRGAWQTGGALPHHRPGQGGHHRGHTGHAGLHSLTQQQA